MNSKETPPTPVNLENVEGRKRIIEEAREGRLALSNSIISRVIGYVRDHIPKPILSLASKAANFTPVGPIKMGTEAILGRTAVGEKVNTKNRIMYGLVAATSLAAHGLLAYGVARRDVGALKSGAELYATSWAIFIAQISPELVINARELAERYNQPELVKFFTSVEAVFKKYGYENMRILLQRITEDKKDEQ
ncbi:MAG: hypothetical protein WC783_02570 [Candidatus Paceibacterota bacterium]|jgi:hypothetical protein